ncbi:L-lactate dehydrogenase complex protein LldE [Dyadobacter jejuensis]|uniref:L-lactate dehydrogenase complex protein LldE n=1 Tax=Dyadobacter jejuensis TaxID=1082580 RepID=A0A316B721_9BACT|nr:(Fe-S)-binding protein [Dyadobacter jejuensis]PWJ58397.1 L-lactate dehydrogenase complex protein LldE [Dyadobacter jejuensis]
MKSISELKVGLFIPCYVDQFYPQVGVATLELLEKLGCKVLFPTNQTCCGQPMANSGFENMTGACNQLFYDCFAGCDYVVSPSGSCVLHLKEHMKVEGREAASKVLRTKVYELVEFITDVLKITEIKSSFPHKVGLHQGCHGQRGLHLAQMSELNAPAYSKPVDLLSKVQGLELVELDRKDECCGFGGTFCVSEEAISVKMGKDRVSDHQRNGAAYITGSDMSCLMHLEGILKRGGSKVEVIHIAQILNGSHIEIPTPQGEPV